MSFYVISGATGHVGSVVTTELLAQGKRVKAIARHTDRATRLRELGAEMAAGALDDREFLAGTLRGAAGFFAMLPPEYPPDDYLGGQRRMADSIAAAVKEAEVPRVVMLSSIGADLESGTGPILGLHYFEKALAATATRLTAIRPAYFQENVAAAIGPARQAAICPSFLPSGKAIPMVATRDIGRLAARLLPENPSRNEVVDLLGPEYTPRQVCEKLAAALGVSLQLVEIPAAQRVDSLVQAGLPKGIAEVMAEMYGALEADRITTRGDRTEIGSTKLEEVLAVLLS